MLVGMITCISRFVTPVYVYYLQIFFSMFCHVQCGLSIFLPSFGSYCKAWLLILLVQVTKCVQ